MAAQLSKADQIRKLMHLSNAEIAEHIGVRVEYVRAVRQRTSPSGNPILGVAETNWRSRPDFPARNRAHVRTWVQNNRERRNAYMREWYRKRRAEARAS